MAAPEVDVGRGEIVEALVVSAMIVMLDESRDLRFEVFLEEVVLQQDAVLECLVPAFVNGGVKTGHGAEQKSATAAPA